MFTEVEVANQLLKCIVEHTIIIVLLDTKGHVLFVCEQLTQE